MYELGTSGDDRERDRYALNVSRVCAMRYTNRVIALLEGDMNNYIEWPEKGARQSGKREAWFEQAVGLINGMEIPLTHKPKQFTRMYKTLNNRYGFQVQVKHALSACGLALIRRRAQAICDFNDKFIYFHFQSYGGASPNRIAIRNTAFWRNRERYFEKGEFIMGALDYGLGDNLFVPFTKEELIEEKEDIVIRRRFNKAFERVGIFCHELRVH